MNLTPISMSRATHAQPWQTRRDFLLSAGGGFGALALTALLGDNPVRAALAPDAVVSPLSPRKPRLPARAKSVIFLFMEGGPSHIDLFDYKPKLNEMAGK